MSSAAATSPSGTPAGSGSSPCVSGSPRPPGSATGWQGHRAKQRAFVVELPGRALSDAEVRRHAAAVAEIAEPG